MPNFKALLLLCAVLWAGTDLQAQLTLPSTFHIKGANNDAIVGYLYYVKDTTCKMDVRQVVQKMASEENLQQAEAGYVFNSRYTTSDYWFAFSLQNDTAYTLPLLWSFYNNNLGFELYDITDTADIKTLGKVLSDEPLSKRQSKIRAPGFKLNLEPNQRKLLLLKVFRLNTENIYFPTDISLAEDVMLWENDFSFQIGRYIGFFIFVALFNIFLGFLLRAKIHLWHALYIGAILLYVLSEYMYDVLFLPDKLYPYFNHLPKIAFLVLALLFGMVEMQTFLQQRSIFPRFYQVFRFFKPVLLALGSLLLVASLSLPPQNKILIGLRVATDIAFLTGTLVMFAFLFSAAWRKNRRARIYLLAASLLLFGYLDFICMALFNIRIISIEPGTILIGLAVEISLLTGIFVANISRERKENFQKLELKKDENLQLSRSLITVQEEERNRIAADLHDSLGANLAALKLLVATTDADNKEELEMVVANAYSDVRNVAHNMLQADLLKSGLYASVQKHLALMNQQKITIFTTAFQGSDSSIPADVSLQLFRIINEATTNIIKHAIAANATVHINTETYKVKVVIDDNGIGIHQAKKTKGIGLRNIATRVAYMQGHMHINSSVKGTIFTMEIPITPE